MEATAEGLSERTLSFHARDGDRCMCCGLEVADNHNVSAGLP